MLEGKDGCNIFRSDIRTGQAGSLLNRCFSLMHSSCFCVQCGLKPPQHWIPAWPSVKVLFLVGLNDTVGGGVRHTQQRVPLLHLSVPRSGEERSMNSCVRDGITPTNRAFIHARRYNYITP